MTKEEWDIKLWQVELVSDFWRDRYEAVEDCKDPKNLITLVHDSDADVRFMVAQHIALEYVPFMLILELGNHDDGIRNSIIHRLEYRLNSAVKKD